MSGGAMKVSNWTSSYNAQFRNQQDVISPNAGEPMHHFPGAYDPSHYQRDPGFYGTRASLAATAREGALVSGQTVRLPVARDGPVGYGQAPVQENASGRTHSFYAPPPARAQQNYSSLRQESIAREGLHTQRVPLAVEGGFGASARLSESQAFAQSLFPEQTQGSVYGGKDLWTHPVLPHGDRSSYGPSSSQRVGGAPFSTQSARFGGQQSFGATNGQGQAAQFGYTQQPSSSSARFSTSGSGSGSSLTGVIDPAFVEQPDEWRYDARGVAQARGVDLSRNTDPRAKYMIPGYSGFIRGKQFAHGQTFAKTTRDCLDVPLDLPTDIDQ